MYVCHTHMRDLFNMLVTSANASRLSHARAHNEWKKKLKNRPKRMYTLFRIEVSTARLVNDVFRSHADAERNVAHRQSESAREMDYWLYKRGGINQMNFIFFCRSSLRDNSSGYSHMTDKRAKYYWTIEWWREKYCCVFFPFVLFFVWNEFVFTNELCLKIERWREMNCEKNENWK